MPNVIKFYEARGPYGEFSNFYVRSIVVNNLTWPIGTEQYFQAMKSDDPDVHEYVRTKLSQPGQIKNWCSPGGAGNITLRADWEESVQVGDELRKRFSDGQGVVVDRVKDHFMFQALVAKFTQHEDLGNVLLATGDAHLIEDTQKVGSDPYWGNGPSGNGLNKLGRMLVLVRSNLERLRAQALVAQPPA
jgi:predicted NAD-dependent protein-ADP-ribosyltransferase YbiA (DUF1768 family)